VITAALLSLLGTLGKFLASLVPSLPDPGPVLSGLTSNISTLYGYTAGSGAWIPWGAGALCLVAVFAVIVIAFGIRLGRIVLSLFTGGGGGAA
jgi:hypothetical protein